jgi:hypothetical protein
MLWASTEVVPLAAKKVLCDTLSSESPPVEWFPDGA